jgi:hypothetical protein
MRIGDHIACNLPFGRRRRSSPIPKHQDSTGANFYLYKKGVTCCEGACVTCKRIENALSPSGRSVFFRDNVTRIKGLCEHTACKEVALKGFVSCADHLHTLGINVNRVKAYSAIDMDQHPLIDKPFWFVPGVTARIVGHSHEFLLRITHGSFNPGQHMEYPVNVTLPWIRTIVKLDLVVFTEKCILAIELDQDNHPVGVSNTFHPPYNCIPRYHPLAKEARTIAIVEALGETFSERVVFYRFGYKRGAGIDLQSERIKAGLEMAYEELDSEIASVWNLFIEVCYMYNGVLSTHLRDCNAKQH